MLGVAPAGGRQVAKSDVIVNESLLLWINQGWAHPWLDTFFIWVSSREFFAFPLMVVILAVLTLKKRRIGLKVWVLLLLTIGVGDALGAWLKDLIGQARPCLDLWEVIRRPEKLGHQPCRGGTDGMPSNHTLNFFVIATFMGLISRSAAWAGTLTVIAVLVGLSRIYLGAHYPLQVLAGAAIGSVTGGLSGWLGRRYLRYDRPAEGEGQKNDPAGRAL